MVPHSERCTKEEYDNIINQSKEINLKYLTNSPDGFIYVQSKDKAFEKWQQNNVRCLNFLLLIMTKIFIQNLS